MEQSSSFRSRLRRLHEQSEVSLRQIDRLADKTEGHTQALLTGTIESPRTDTVRALARVLGCTVGWLLEGEGAEPTPADVRAAVERARAARDSHMAATGTEG